MRTASLLLLATLVSSAAPDWENPEVFAVNKERPRATFVPFHDRSTARNLQAEKSAYVQSLDGEWSFHWSPDPASRPADFHQPGFDRSSWTTIPVPSNWQLHGHGTPIYTNNIYPFKRDPPRVTGKPPKDWPAYHERNPVGSYLTEFTIPDGWAHRRIIIHFRGVESAFYLWVNGRKVGYSQGSYTPAEFDLTEYIQNGTNSLAVEVYR